MELKHDRLQQDCFVWLHNNYPELRKTFWAVINELKPFPGETKSSFAKRLNYLKSIGLVSGVFDFHLYHNGILHVFDFKVGKDRFSEDQKAFASQIENNGGKWYEIRNINDFKNIITCITKK